MAEAPNGTDPTVFGNPHCPECDAPLAGSDLSDLRCSACGSDLPPRLGI